MKIDPKNLIFENWNNIAYENKTIQSSEKKGKTYFYYDENYGELHMHRFSRFELFLRRLFGYRRRYSRENFTKFLKIREGEPAVNQALASSERSFRKKIETLADRVFITENTFSLANTRSGRRQEQFINYYLETKHPIDPNWRDREGNSVLGIAVAVGNASLVQKAIEAKCSISNPENATPLFEIAFAFHKTNYELLETLLKNSVQPVITHTRTSTAMHEAISEGNEKLFDLFLPYLNIYANSFSLFHTALKKEDKTFMKKIADHKNFNPNASGEDLFSRETGSIAKVTGKNMTLLHLAVAHNSKEAVEILLKLPKIDREKQADVAIDGGDVSALTPLQLAQNMQNDPHTLQGSENDKKIRKAIILLLKTRN